MKRQQVWSKQIANALSSITVPRSQEAVNINVLDTPVDELEFSVRVSNVFKSENFVTIGDFVRKSEWQLLRLPHFGKVSLREVKSVLAEKGLVIAKSSFIQESSAAIKPERTTEKIGDEPIDTIYEKKMTVMMRVIDEIINDNNTGIVILLVPRGNVTGRCNFMSNGIKRADLAALFQKMIERVWSEGFIDEES